MVQNQYMKEMLGKSFDRKQITPNFSSKTLKNQNNKIKKKMI